MAFPLSCAASSSRSKNAVSRRRYGAFALCLMLPRAVPCACPSFKCLHTRCCCLTLRASIASQASSRTSSSSVPTLKRTRAASTWTRRYGDIAFLVSPYPLLYLPGTPSPSCSSLMSGCPRFISRAEALLSPAARAGCPNVARAAVFAGTLHPPSCPDRRLRRISTATSTRTPASELPSRKRVRCPSMAIFLTAIVIFEPCLNIFIEKIDLTAACGGAANCEPRHTGVYNFPSVAVCYCSVIIAALLLSYFDSLIGKDFGNVSREQNEAQQSWHCVWADAAPHTRRLSREHLLAHLSTPVIPCYLSSMLTARTR